MVQKVEEEMRKAFPGIVTWGNALPEQIGVLVAEVVRLRRAAAPVAGSLGAQQHAQPDDDGWEYPWHGTRGAAVGALADKIREKAKVYKEALVKAQKWIEGPGALSLAEKALDKDAYKWIEATVGQEEYVRAHLDVLQSIGIIAYINDVPGGGFSLKVDMNGVRCWAAASSRGA